MRQETKVCEGKITINEDGEEREIIVPLTVIETYHENGRKDCTIQVPRISTKSKTQNEEK